MLTGNMVNLLDFRQGDGSGNEVVFTVGSRIEVYEQESAKAEPHRAGIDICPICSHHARGIEPPHTLVHSGYRQAYFLSDRRIRHTVVRLKKP